MRWIKSLKGCFIKQIINTKTRKGWLLWTTSVMTVLPLVRLRFCLLDARVDHRCATPALHFSSHFFPSVSILTYFSFHFSFSLSLSLAILSFCHIPNSSLLFSKRRFFSPSNLPSFSQELSTTVQLDLIQFFTQKSWRFLAQILLLFFVTQTRSPIFDIYRRKHHELRRNTNTVTITRKKIQTRKGCVCTGTTFSTFCLHWDDCVLKLLRVRFTYGIIPFFFFQVTPVLNNYKSSKEVRMSFSHNMDDEYEKLIQRMNPPSQFVFPQQHAGINS
ncbi:hypothetical protein DVH24_012239 [Malus domestica]|uniref:Uncharacterized protein n=1 Tax=Malus domestica TaxID=3750 RepID=A0A498HSM1_MALDO|nr:hypothetical protein DVH24_012239 [Malus domestica]